MLTFINQTYLKNAITCKKFKATKTACDLSVYPQSLYNFFCFLSILLAVQKKAYQLSDFQAFVWLLLVTCFFSGVKNALRQENLLLSEQLS